MPRIAGVDIPDNKKIYYSLQYIHGIGPKFAADILVEAQVTPDVKARELDDQQVAMINSIIDSIANEIVNHIKNEYRVDDLVATLVSRLMQGLFMLFSRGPSKEEASTDKPHNHFISTRLGTCAWLPTAGRYLE